MAETLFFQVNGRSVTTDVAEVAGLLGDCGEPSPSLPAVAILASDSSVAGLPLGTRVFRYPSQATLAAAEIGVALPAQGLAGGVEIVEAPGQPVTSITATQIRLWLFRRGIDIAEVARAIEGIEDESARGEAMILWEYAPYIDRNNPLVEAVASLLGMTARDIDAAFAEAATL
jgi:hypothetical protein